MNCNTRYHKESRKKRLSCYSVFVKSLVLSILIFTGIQVRLPAQAFQYTKPSWWFGAAGGVNFNFHRGSTQQLNADITAPGIFNRGDGNGLYLAPLVAFHRPDAKWGIMLQTGFDSRKGSFHSDIDVCNCATDFSTDLSYFTIEPSLRFSLFRSIFYLYGGPRLAFNLDKSFIYNQGGNPDFPEQLAIPEQTGDLSRVNKTLVSMQIGGGFDLPLSAPNRRTQLVLSPFLSYQPYAGQSPRSVETWRLTNLRLGAALKLGHGRQISKQQNLEIKIPDNVSGLDSKIQFSVKSPRNIPDVRRVRETFPLRNYIFFDIGSTEIPDRYVLLLKNQVADFKEDQLEVFAPKKLSGRSGREMVVYYNILNILGDRMGKDRSTRITLVGSSEKGPEDGKAMAESVKRYLTSLFEIDASRIGIQGRDKPKIPSEQPGGMRELSLLREGDRRVSIESSSPSLLMEFQSGADAPLKPVEIIAIQEAPLDSYVTFTVAGGKEILSSWSLAIQDEEGKRQLFGPYVQQDQVSIAGKTILGARPEGDFKVTMTGETKSGEAVVKTAFTHMVLWQPPQNEQGMRFSVLFEFNDSKAVAIYEKYLTEIVAPKIPNAATVIIHGYTDIIGDESNNMNLSLARANSVRNILETSLSKTGRKDVTFEAFGFGENPKISPFENSLPEERFYNRTVIIDIFPRN